ncbi:Sodium- and chloride-dependent GABA transporter 2,Sodium- and chloride-dependent taurine transporter,Inactive sodium-dependent neutral amino acid transporter B(0)AT3,Sodium-dependent dopamine transporter,Sodium- and chloride-dependent glycine transporter 2,Sodium-dependent noradrenaline transporter,Sodium- and chloride-dependent GABA transporter 1,Sodium- and chloride-dependent betaine transporter,Sodium-dependent proline transporter,Sodium-dependent neutral amino acid transporter B(0)AT1,Sodium- and chlor|uniref:Transporter n=1 Tax=Mytilus edulis TaxID=6550 RepID=A0A8S3PXI1_MYTED|nr:Sodium- and chloride-dependent GABA transporter 2,Sodium- and chloride-dependent taurine transporter,Inactive sodium-dependent neutral amino acid transporter B(0)AT3,Sodium-dependent dopamine transporter,Sodium- and chloride-dependent glycine transporter 2,Sodium-dependent noradrenaline transporter,Sodium- and chloride-dependent GABA transporter 1,Sodium- and chloride-dependent betaine transporter,Sodium-dependent proline transporter,Sodium-dependent neutral amino acid transporter B(0)AT1,Sodium
MPLSKTTTVTADEGLNRGQWTHKMDYILSVMGWSVGLGNLWRFPYVCMKNGGGAFLIPYIVCLVTFSLPIFFLEASVGQFLGKGCTNVFNVCPLLKGVGYSMTTVIFLYGVIYTIINAWILYYIGHSFVSPLPWTTCDNEWNSPNCISHQGYKCQSKYQNMTRNETDAVTSYKQYNASSVNTTVVCTTNGSWITAPEEFWRDTCILTFVCEGSSILAGAVIFSVLGYLAKKYSIPIEDVVKSGTNQTSKDFEMMNGQGIPIYFRICICFIAPLLLLTIFISGMVSYKAPTHGDYQYPKAAIAFGFILSLLPLIPIPVFAIRSIKKAPGHTFKEKLKLVFLLAEIHFLLETKFKLKPAEISFRKATLIKNITKALLWNE